MLVLCINIACSCQHLASASHYRCIRHKAADMNALFVFMSAIFGLAMRVELLFIGQPACVLPINRKISCLTSDHGLHFICHTSHNSKWDLLPPCWLALGGSALAFYSVEG